MERNPAQKRKRSENWNEEDKKLLKELIKERVKMIENKNTDTNTNSSKKKAWIEVQESFNNLCTGGQRNVTQLKTQWMATKIAARKEMAEHRKEMTKTGGGLPPQDMPLNCNDICVWLPNEFKVDSNEFDSDIVEQETQIPLDREQIVDSEVEEDEEDEPKSFPKLKKKIPTKAKYSTEENIKKLTDFDIECRKELHQLQMEVEKKRIRNLEREYDLIEAKIKLLERKSLDPN